jgi:hypothetical protein
MTGTRVRAFACKIAALLITTATAGLFGAFATLWVVPLNGIGLLTREGSSSPRWGDRPLTCQEEG